MIIHLDRQTKRALWNLTMVMCWIVINTIKWTIYTYMCDMWFFDWCHVLCIVSIVTDDVHNVWQCIHGEMGWWHANLNWQALMSLLTDTVCVIIVDVRVADRKIWAKQKKKTKTETETKLKFFFYKSAQIQIKLQTIINNMQIYTHTRQ